MKIILDLTTYQIEIIRQLVAKELNSCNDHRHELKELLGVHKEAMIDILKQLT